MALEIPQGIKLLNPDPLDERCRVSDLTSIANDMRYYIGFTDILNLSDGFRYDITGYDVSTGWVFKISDGQGKINDITHATSGELTIDLDKYNYTTVLLEANVTGLNITGGKPGNTYHVLFTQDSVGGRTLTLAEDYPISGTVVNQGEKYLYEFEDLNGFITTTRVYKVAIDYQTVDINSDITDGDLYLYCSMDEGVKPMLSYEEGLSDLLSITVIKDSVYLLELNAHNI